MQRLLEPAGTIRSVAIPRMVVGLACLVGVAAAKAEPGPGANPQRIAALIRKPFTAAQLEATLARVGVRPGSGRAGAG